MVEPGQILIIGNENEFLLKTVTMEMKRRGYDPVVARPAIDNVNEAGKGIKTYLLFVDSAEAIKELLIFIKDKAADKRIQIGLIGERLDIQEALKYLLKENAGMTFERPADAKVISDGLEQLYETAVKSNERKRILIIDDDPEFMRRTERVLHNHYKEYMANSGASALMLLSRHKVDLILLDYMMPILNGPKVLETLKSEPDTADIPVIFLSGLTDARSITNAMLLGSETYISKAMASTELCTTISDFFTKQDYKKGMHL